MTTRSRYLDAPSMHNRVPTAMIIQRLNAVQALNLHKMIPSKIPVVLRLA